ncbi:MAG TPA: discoidin domain-containing protein [Armatimonadota bacterium]|jgi:hypothetical protein
MTCSKIAARIGFAALACMVSLAIAPRASAQWADQRYANRVPITVSNYSSHAFASGELVTATLPASVLTGVRSDGADVALYQGATAVPVKLLPMGGSLKAILPLQGALAALGPWSVTENLSAGSTGYTNLPAGTVVTPTNINGDDGGSTMTLPFDFRFGQAPPTRSVFFSIDGYLVPGSAQPTSLYGRGNANTPGIYPFTSDYTVSATGGPAGANMYFFADATKAVFRWEVAESGQSTVIAKFAVILYPNGDIRFVYSDTVHPTSSATGGPGGYAEMSYGVEGDTSGTGIIHFPTDMYPDSADLSNHADIAYTQTLPVPPAQTFSLYYNGPSVSTGPTAPASVQSWDFSDGQKHSWRSHQDLVNNADCKIVTDVDGVSSLYMDASDPNDEDPTTGNHPWFSPSNMTPLGDQTVYWKARRPDWDYACFPAMRFNPVTLTDSNSLSYLSLAPGTSSVGFQFGENYSAGGFLTAEYYTPADTPYTNGRTPALPHQFTNHTWTPNPVDTDKWQFFVTSCWDTGGATMLGGKGWQVPPSNPTLASDPAVGGYTMTWDSASDSTVVAQPVPPGIIAWMHHSNSAFLKWVCAVPGGFAERVATSLAAAETAPAPGPGMAVIQGVAYDDSVGVTAPIAGITLTLKDAANNVLATSVTDSTGRYRYVVAATATPATVTISGVKPGSKGSATQSVVENTVYTVNVPIAFGSRATGIVYDTQTNGGVVGATVNLLTPGTSTVVFTTTTDSAGRYGLDMDAAGTYDVAVIAGSYTPQTVTGVTFPLRTVVTKDFGLVAPELLANGGFETEAPVVDPAGYPGAMRPAGFTTWDQQATAVTAPISNDVALLNDAIDTTETFYLNSAALARTGTHCVAIKRTKAPDGTVIGSTSVQWMCDTGGLIPTSPNQRYRVSLWAKGIPGMYVRARVRFHTTNISASTAGVVFTGTDTTFNADRTGGRWQQFSAIITAPSAAAFMNVRFYGNYTGKGTAPQVVYFDDVSVKAISPRTITGTVVDGSGTGVGGIVVGANLGRPGMTEPAVSTASSSAAGSVGAFTLNLWDKGAFSLQTYKPNFIAGAQTMLNTATSYTPATPVTLTAPATPAIDVAVAAKVSSTDALGEAPEAFLSVADILGFDGSNVNRGGGQWSQWRTINPIDTTSQLPITITADLGRAYTTSQLTWVWAWSGGGPQSYDVLTSEDGSTYTLAYQAVGTGSLGYTDSNGNTHSAITLATPVKLRYVRMILRSLDRNNDANIGFSEFRVDLPAANVTGKVTKLDGTPISGAFVGFRGGSGSMVSLGTTDGTGAYKIALPTNNIVGLVAHYVPDGDNVVAITDPLDAQASAFTTAAIPTIKVADPVTNLVPLNTPTHSDPSIDETANPATAGSDHNLTTRWGTDLGAQVRPGVGSTMSFVYDLGTPKTFNQANIIWEYGFGGWYLIETSADATNWTTILTNHSNYSGYTLGAGKFVDVQTLPLTTAQYVRIHVEWNETQWTSIWELQLANVTANPPVPFTLTKQALKIAAGLLKAASTDMTPLNVVTTGTSATVIDMADVVALAKQAK